jgi:hypothetical protein
VRNQWVWASLVVLPLAVAAGLVYANAPPNDQPRPEATAASGYVCPVTGEELPCPNCCPFNQAR